MPNRRVLILILLVIFLIPIMYITGCNQDNLISSGLKTVPRDNTWGIYELDIDSLGVRLIYSSETEIFTSSVRLSNAGDWLVFAQKTGGQSNEHLEIYTIGVDGSNLTRLTNNSFWDVYPAWSPDDNSISFLSLRETNLDIYIMDADGSNQQLLFDSGSHNADVDWVGDTIVFTSGNAIWKVNSDGTQAVQVTNPPGRGNWGVANLPVGDYDPRLSPDGGKIAFERLEDVMIPNGGYNIFVINSDGTGERRLTGNGYSQGLASWSYSGKELVYMVAAIDGEGQYDIYVMNSDGSNNRSVTPDYFPADFLCHAPIFSDDDSKILFIGQWWQ